MAAIYTALLSHLLSWAVVWIYTWVCIPSGMLYVYICIHICRSLEASHICIHIYTIEYPTSPAVAMVRGFDGGITGVCRPVKGVGCVSVIVLVGFQWVL